jgi:beta-xylosidase
LLLQKFPAPAFTVTAKVVFTPRIDRDQAGLILMGADYAYLALKKKPDGVYVSEVVCRNADQGEPEKESAAVAVKGDTFYLRVSVTAQAVSRFSYSVDGANFVPIGEPFTARQGRWIGAKAGLFALGSVPVAEYGYADFDWFRVE